MKKKLLFLLSISPVILFGQFNIVGKIYDKASNEALVGANVLIKNSFYASYADIDGEFSFRNIKETSTTLIVSYIGYNTDTIKLNLSKDESLTIYLTPKTFKTEEIIVLATRAGDKSPTTKTNLNFEQIAENNMGADIPYLLQQTPSVVATSDAGAGIGYSGIRIRGVDPTGINVTVNGIPINDSESHGVFWVNMPDLASSLSSIQIQRGVGTSTNGAGAFGASINMQTDGLTKKSFAEIDNSFGSFNSRKHTIKIGSGLINNRFAVEGRLSKINSDGYIDRATADLSSYFLSGTYYGKKTIIKALTFGGRERTYQSWYGTPEAKLTGDLAALEETISNEWFSDKIANNLRNSGRTYNHYLYEDEVDNYGQDHYQLHFSRELSSKVTANLAFHYTHGEGYFEQFKDGEDFADYKLNDVILNSDTITSTDLIRRRWLDNDFYGITYSILYNPSNKANINFGGGINQYDGDHFGEIIWAEHTSNSFPGDNYYFNYGEKTDANIYLKSQYQVNKKTIVFADLQGRIINYETKGTDNDQKTLDIEEDFQFFNPKLGASYRVSENATISILAAIGNREPNRGDLIDKDTLANKSEQLKNLEIGFSTKGKNYIGSINIYYMLYKDQLINTGKVNDVGSPVRENIDESYRRGIELSGTYAFSKKIELLANITLSQNKIIGFEEEFEYTKSNGDNVSTYRKANTNIAFSPSITANSELIVRPLKDLEIGFQSRYIGKQYLDNSEREFKSLESYIVSDLRIEYNIPIKTVREIKIMARVNNIFSEKYSSNGYTYSYAYQGIITENFLFPQAFRNYMIGLNIKF
jgi:iron complex outermembrane receptor protein